MKDAPVNTALFLGALTVIMSVAIWDKKDPIVTKVEINAAYSQGLENGKKLGQLEAKTTMAKQVTDNVCMSWWYNGDTTRVAKSIQKVKFQ